MDPGKFLLAISGLFIEINSKITSSQQQKIRNIFQAQIFIVLQTDFELTVLFKY
jgi:hypothetical protein